MREHRLVDVRLNEQLESSTIIVDNRCDLLIPRGNSLAKFSRTLDQCGYQSGGN